MLGGLGKDISLALRTLRRQKGFLTAALLTLALGIGATTTIFSLVYHVLLKPMPYPEPDELVRIWSTYPEKGIESMGVSTGDVVEWRRRNNVFEGIGAWYVMGRTLRGGEVAEVVTVAQVSRDFFPILDVRPFLGRTFTAEETARATFNSAAAPVGTDPVVVLSYETWQRLGSDPSIVGRYISLERQSWRVVGVMPADFDMPSSAVELWIPWSFRGQRPHDQRYLEAIARLKPGLSIEAAEADMNAVALALGEELPETNEGWRVRLVPAQEEMVGSTRPVLWIVFAAVGCVLLVACVNITGLQLARMIERQRELVVRVALGASRGHLVRQLLAEGLVLALLGGGLAVPVAMLGLEILGSLLPPDFLRRIQGIELDYRLLGFTSVLALAIALFLGLVPVFTGAPSNLTSTLKKVAGGVSGDVDRYRLRSLLVVGEIAMTVLLLAAAGLLVRSLRELESTDPGFRPENVVVLPVTLDNREYDSEAKARAYYSVLVDKLGSLPGVTSVGGVTALPLSPIGPNFDRPIWAEGKTPPPGGSRRADVRMATPGYFRALGMSLLKGRGFDDRDAPDAPRVVIVNESLARQIWHGEDPTGKRLVIDYSSSGTYPYEVIGLVNDIRFYGLRRDAKPELYLPHAQRPYLIMNIAVRTASDPAALIPRLREAVLEVDPLQPAHSVVPLADLVDGSVSRDRFATRMVGGFAAAALLLALLGIFGVLSYHVGQRTHEVGIRTALGASPTAVVGMMLSVGFRLTLAGLGLGILLSLSATRALASLLYGVSPSDPLTLTLVCVVVLMGTLFACYLPARRAARIDPVVALRHE